MLVSNWKSVLLKSWAVWVATLGAAIPELLDFLAANVNLLADIGLSDRHKNLVRLACLVGVILVRPLKQGLSKPPGQ